MKRPLVAIAVVGITLALAATSWLRTRPRPEAPASALPTQALLDSAVNASTRQDWVAAVPALERLNHRFPGNSTLICDLGQALHNYAVVQRPRAGVPHPAMRNSLERMETEQQVFALLDSAAAVARTEEQWLEARERYAETFENLGLPLDALVQYGRILRRVPTDRKSGGRVSWVRIRLRDPLVVDSVAKR
jgi:hypothetical protein